jgi:hypothetical protein
MRTERAHDRGRQIVHTLTSRIATGHEEQSRSVSDHEAPDVIDRADSDLLMNVEPKTRQTWHLTAELWRGVLSPAPVRESQRRGVVSVRHHHHRPNVTTALEPSMWTAKREGRARHDRQNWSRVSSSASSWRRLRWNASTLRISSGSGPCMAPS